MAGRGLMQQFVGIFALAAVLLTVPVMASIGPNTWISYRVIGVDGDRWVAMRVERLVSSYYMYRTKTEVHVVKAATGCSVSRVLLSDIEAKDADTYGNWSTKAKGTGAVPAVMLKMTPVVPADWRHAVKVV